MKKMRKCRVIVRHLTAKIAKLIVSRVISMELISKWRNKVRRRMVRNKQIIIIVKIGCLRLLTIARKRRIKSK